MYLAAITESDALSAIRLTLLVAVIVVPLNTIFGIAAAWAVTKFRFRGKQVLLSLLELAICSFTCYCWLSICIAI